MERGREGGRREGGGREEDSEGEGEGEGEREERGERERERERASERASERGLLPRPAASLAAPTSPTTATRAVLHGWHCLPLASCESQIWGSET